jgi:hypothetical protein
MFDKPISWKRRKQLELESLEFDIIQLENEIKKMKEKKISEKQ